MHVEPTYEERLAEQRKLERDLWLEHVKVAAMDPSVMSASYGSYDSSRWTWYRLQRTSSSRNADLVEVFAFWVGTTPGAARSAHDRSAIAECVSCEGP